MSQPKQEKTVNELANEIFDIRMKKEKYDGTFADDLRRMFILALLKYSMNSLKFGSEYLKELLAKGCIKYTYYDIGVMLNLVRGAAFEMIGGKTDKEVLAIMEILESEYLQFGKVADRVWAASEKEAQSKVKVTKK